MLPYHTLRTTGRALLALVALAPLLLVIPAPSVAQAPDERAVVTGRVVDDFGEPVPSLEVMASRDGRRIGRAVTDGQGGYRLSISPGMVRVTVPASMGWASAESVELRIVSGGTLSVDLQVERQVYDSEAILVSVSGPGTRETLGGVSGTVHHLDRDEIRAVATPNPIDPVRNEPGVDLVPTGLGSRVLTFRGFNNIFSGALRYLVDYRKAGLPSLRANFTHFVPTTSSDMESMEIILGPSSAIYGPNSANGVLNVLTRSPLDLPETYAAVSGGSQSVFQGDFRTSQRLGDRVGFKISSRWFQGQEYPYLDPTEVAIRDTIEANPDAFRNQLRDIGVAEDEIAVREGRVGIRNLDIERWSADARVDWTPSEGDTLFFQAGRTTTTGIEVTPLGAGQAGGWTYDYLQGRLQSGSLFAQAFLNTSDAGDTYLLRDGGPLVDRSSLFGAQLRHGFAFADGREEITYGGDWSRTTPKTGGTIHGQFEDEDVITEYGAYVQSRTRLFDPLHLIGTVRVDESNVIEDPVVSPRVGLVYEPVEGQTLSASWSRGFSTPTPTEYFLDLSAGGAPGDLGALGYRVRARGTGREGIRFSDGQGGFQGMRSPCTPAELGGPSQLLPVASTPMWHCAVGILLARGEIDPATADYLRTLDPSGAVSINALDPLTQTLAPLVPGSVEDVEPLGENTTTTMEVGYRGLVGGKVFLQTSLWRTRKENFTSPLLLRTPLLTLNGPELAAFLVDGGLPPDQAQAIAEGVAPVPLAVLSSEDIRGAGAELIATYENYGSLVYWGLDLGARTDLTRSLTLSASMSWVSDDHFDIDGRLVPLNAPELKGTVALGLANLSAPLSGELRLRHHSGFPVSSGDYVGTACLGVEGRFVEECVDAATLVDATVGYELLASRDIGLRVSVTNVLGTDYRPFIGVPTTGRRIMARLEYRLR